MEVFLKLMEKEQQMNFDGIATALQVFINALEPYKKSIDHLMDHFDEILPVLEVMARESKAYQVIESLIKHQYVVISPIHPDMIDIVVTDQIIEKYLEQDEKVKQTIDYISQHLNANFTFSQSMEAFWNRKYNIAILGFVAILDRFLSTCSGQIINVNFKSRAEEIKKKVDEKGNLYLDDLETKDFALYVTYVEVIKDIGKGQNFKKSEPQKLDRNWISHGRTDREYSRFDCVRVLNMIYGTIRMAEIGKEDEAVKFI